MFVLPYRSGFGSRLRGVRRRDPHRFPRPTTCGRRAHVGRSSSSFANSPGHRSSERLRTDDQCNIRGPNNPPCLSTRWNDVETNERARGRSIGLPCTPSPRPEVEWRQCDCPLECSACGSHRTCLDSIENARRGRWHITSNKPLNSCSSCHKDPVQTLEL